jgi:colanic acid/amylovoran biosynthesis glycosyltransferase
MRIGLVLSQMPVYSETFLVNKIKGLKDAGETVILFTGRHGLSQVDGVRVCAQWPVWQRWRLCQPIPVIIGLLYGLVKCPRTCMRFIRLERSDGSSWPAVFRRLYINLHILTAGSLDWLHFAFAALAVERENVAKALGARMAVSFRGYDVSIYSLKHPGCFEKLWRKVDKVHNISESLLKSAYGLGLPDTVPAQKITPAIDTAHFERILPIAALSAEEKRPLALLTVGRLTWKKGLEYTLEALALLQRQGVDFTYTIIGDGEEYERLVLAAHQFGIRDKVRFAGKVPHEQVKFYYEQADIYLQYSVQEGFCNAVLEAQAMGLLCVVSDAEGLPENVLHGLTGWVVPKRQPELLAKQIREILKMDGKVLGQIRRTAIERVHREFNLENQRREFLVFYESD